jgi:hypothetical protein
MKIEIEATQHLTEISGVPVRLWEGKTESGIPCKVFVHRIAVAAEKECQEFETELQEKAPPGRPIDLRHIL